jgi:hypothetical protein
MERVRRVMIFAERKMSAKLGFLRAFSSTPKV